MQTVLDYVIRIADGLDYAHLQGVIHRDIKPANIMLLKDKSLRITDFGIARITASSKTQTGTVMGTPSYMSPEQLAGKKVDGRSDLFSLGVMLYEMLTGSKPFEGESIAELLYKISNEKQPDPKLKNPNIPDSVVKVIDKALEKNPENRYQRGSEIANDLKECLKSL
jgi:serine/threonine-protein kinase